MAHEGRLVRAIGMKFVSGNRHHFHLNRRIPKELGTLAAIVQSSDDAIISKDLSSIITSWNLAAERLFGYTAKEAIGNSMLLLFPEGKEHEEREIIKRISQGETIKHFETLRRHKDGRLIDVSITISPILDSKGQIIGASKAVRDITERRREMQELERYRDHLEDLVSERTAQIREANERLSEHEQFLTTITDNFPGMVGYWDRNLHCQFANRACIQYFGLSMEALRSALLPDLIGPEAFDHDRPMIEAVLAGQTQSFERPMSKRFGTDRHYHFQFIPDNKDGTIEGFFILVTDVTDIKQSENELRSVNQRLKEALEQANAANNAKTQFLANMSHEIRTPMNAVLGFLALALESELSHTVRRQLTTAHHSARSLLLLLNNILDISKLQSGKIEFESVSFNLPKLLRSSLDMLQIKARDKKLNLQLYYPPQLEHCYLGDPMRIRQIVTNLLGNAIKFTDSGSVTVRVLREEGTGHLRLSVSDTGIGMTEEQAKRIFMPFIQADSSTTRRYGGTGLGVSICKQLSERMGGRIWVESQPDVGTTFYVSLPLNEANCTHACEDESTTGTAQTLSPRRFKILLVDDIEENIELAAARLTSQGHSVTTVRNGAQAVEATSSQSFDVILMDVHMPEMNGMEASREIRRRETGQDSKVPIIALTASVLLSEQQECFRAGMDAFVAKPIEFPQLFRLMEHHIRPGRGDMNTTLQRRQEPDPAPLISLPGLDIADGRRRWGDGDQYIRALLGFAARYGHSGCRMRECFASRSWTEGHEAAHALKGVASNLGMTELAEVAAHINDAFKRKDADSLPLLLEDLDAIWGTAMISVQTYARQSTQTSQESSDHPIPQQLDEAMIKDLKTALDSDNPDTIEPVLHRIESALSAEDRNQLRQMIQDFDFIAARKLADHLAAPTSLG